MKRSIFFLGALFALPLLQATGVAAPSPGLGPVLAGHTWLNGRLTRNDLRGRVVLVDVFTFECINCVRVTPNLQSLNRAYGRRDSKSSPFIRRRCQAIKGG